MNGIYTRWMWRREARANTTKSNKSGCKKWARGIPRCYRCFLASFKVLLYYYHPPKKSQLVRHLLPTCVCGCELSAARERAHMILYLNETDITILFGGGKIGIGDAVPLSAKRKSIHRNETEPNSLVNLSCSIYFGGFTTRYLYVFSSVRIWIEGNWKFCWEKIARFFVGIQSVLFCHVHHRFERGSNLSGSPVLIDSWVLLSQGHANSICCDDQWQGITHRRRESSSESSSSGENQDSRIKCVSSFVNYRPRVCALFG